MALFNKKEFESLQAENAELKDKIILLEARLSARDKKLSECNDTIEQLNAEIKKYKVQLTDTFSSHQVKNLQQQFNKYISELENEIAALKNRPHNERGAGRKHKATSEQRNYILSLFEQGISQYKIARMMTEQTGGKWNKTTVRNIIIAANN